MFREPDQFLATLDVPETHGSILAAKHEPPPIRSERHTGGRSLVSLEYKEFRATIHVLEPRGSTFPGIALERG